MPKAQIRLNSQRNCSLLHNYYFGQNADGENCSNLSTKRKIFLRTKSVFKPMLFALVFLSFLIVKKDNQE